MEDFTERVVKLLKEVPAGTVASYGQIARLAGNPRAARQVARILHSMSRKHGIPWHRIVNAKGEIVIRDGEAAFEQEERLREEGVPVIGGKRVDMGHYRWEPGNDELPPPPY
ncbi:methylated-DNA--protein-cysteine methyltransferase [Bhargavaea cecembensis DSE10]|uniref:Methylated-DNA--protein-cysteine methyltransferase n=1 Tax=Bhargavaea cecembensis DSE10 TaxID=1235279 RepID=M7NXQ1_9BACL|nr:methylated-DNA--[protein]-cysteine S-methyltransferase [Bhargavaea cecembensis]EMR06440.1 methylated-DNA--protein-cysteine methyltransferase [Bhargavaea cecembensis DSE10]